MSDTKDIKGCGFDVCFVRQGASFTTTVLVTPLFFGAAHLHHLHDLVHFQRVPLATALAMVGVCLMPNCVCKNWSAVITRSFCHPLAVCCCPNPSANNLTSLQELWVLLLDVPDPCDRIVQPGNGQSSRPG